MTTIPKPLFESPAKTSTSSETSEQQIINTNKQKHRIYTQLSDTIKKKTHTQEINTDVKYYLKKNKRNASECVLLIPDS